MITVAGKPLLAENVDRDWPKVLEHIRDWSGQIGIPLLQNDVQLARKTFEVWVTSPKYDRGNVGNAYVKDVDSLAELARGLLGNVHAANSRRQEEILAWLVINNLHAYESVVLDRLFTVINRLTRDNVRYQTPPTRYGGLVKGVRWDTDQWSATNQKGEKHEVLYVKMGLIHSFALSVIKDKKVEIKGRKQSGEMRKEESKGSLVETHPQVYQDRLQGVSVWAGTSGSTMDIIWFAKKVAGITDDHSLTCLAWCAFAFFHIMPTGQSPTHTFHEVMRGAKQVAPEIKYDPSDTRLPPVDPLTMRSKL
ncbi:MAG TPA: hypothetical protein VF710_02575 [Longimicrobium sp.]|jgi:hypothetical protein